MTDEKAVETPKKEKAEKIVILMNRGHRMFTVADGKKTIQVRPGDCELKASIAEKLVKDYPKEFKILGKQ